MKATLITIACFFLLLATQAQEGWGRRERQAFKDADFAFYQGDYGLAYDNLEKLYKVDSTYLPVQYELGVILLDWKNDKKRALEMLSVPALADYKEAWFPYGRALHRNMRFEEAIDWFNRYLSSGDEAHDYREVQRHIQISKRAIEAISDPVDVSINNLGPKVNTEAKEYVPLVTPDNRQLYFTSRRGDSTARLKDPNGEYFEDIYQSTTGPQGWAEAVNLGQPINSETHDATVSITADGKTMILYRTNRNLTGGDLYITNLKNGKWTDPKKLPNQINSDYQEASATLSPDKRMLIFSSNRPGGYGGKDLYRVKMLPNGEWSLPRNLGPSINTPYDEDAPHLDVDGLTLYFASQGHSTIGGYDLFRVEMMEGETWSVPENLGFPANTVDDDIFLSLDAGGRRGYFSSARPGGFGEQDLYSIDFIYRQQQTLVIQSEVRSINGLPLSAVITVIDEKTREVQGIYRSNANTGKFILVINPLTSYKVVVESQEYETVSDELFFPFPEEDEDEIKIAPYMLRRK
ncbi:hypothetical protein [Sanyastnella coralliicola]|uniref:hypothetical protein n=1 Tax=Sanyastnella coralliicola TaxID=3069118 RepID=UPI0027B9833A|nr:hypothetical protein [Longitalea sp. SCSIO 12813]